MIENHFQLLVLSNQNPIEFSGPLARVLSPHLKNNAMVKAYTSTIGRFKRGNQIELLGMTTQISDDGVFLASATGPMSSIPDAKKAVQSVEGAVRRRGKPIIRRYDTLIYTSYQPPVPTKASMKLLGNHLALVMDGHPQPTVCTLQVTTKCQANCVHCSAVRYKDPNNVELTTDEWKKVITDSQQLGVVSVVFTGGEPLTRPDIYELIDYVDKDEAIAMMFCNGLLLNEKNVKKLAASGLHAIHVSIDSPNPDEHDNMRRVPGCFQKAVDGLERCKDAGIMTGISTYATPERLHNGQIVEMIELAKRIGTDEITIFDVVPTGRLLMEDRKHLLTDEDKTELCRIEEEYNVGHSLPQVITQAHINGPTGNGCFAGWCQFYVTAFGDMTPCDFTPLSFGNVRSEGVEASWEKIVSHENYGCHNSCCRMQDPEFRAQWIDKIPHSGPFPYPISDVDKLPDPSENEVPQTAVSHSSVGIKH